MDNLGGVVEIGKISILSNWQGIKNSFYKITGQPEKVQTTKAQEMFNFATKVIIPGSEENKIFFELIEQTFGDILYEVLNSSTEEQQRRVGYLLGEVLIGIILSKGIGKIADTIADSSKGVKYAISVSDDLLEMEYVDDIATYSAKMLSTKTDDVVKIADDTIDLVKNSGVTLESIRANKHNLIGKSVDEIADMLKKEGYVVNVRKSTNKNSLAKAIEVSNTSKERNISQILVSPGSKRHGDVPYVKISTTNQGRIKIIEGTSATYKTDGTEKAILIFTGEN